MFKNQGTEAVRNLSKMSQLVPRPMCCPQWLQGLSCSHYCSANEAVLSLSGLSSYLYPLWSGWRSHSPTKGASSVGSDTISTVWQSQLSPPSPLMFPSENNILFQKPGYLNFYFSCSFSVYSINSNHTASLWFPNNKQAMPTSSSQLQDASSIGHIASACPGNPPEVDFLCASEAESVMA